MCLCFVLKINTPNTVKKVKIFKVKLTYVIKASKEEVITKIMAIADWKKIATKGILLLLEVAKTLNL